MELEEHFQGDVPAADEVFRVVEDAAWVDGYPVDDHQVDAYEF